MTVLTKNVIDKGRAFTQAEAALCIWEYTLQGTDHSKKVYEWIKDGEGAAQARQNCIEIAHFVEHAYQVGNGGKDALTNWCFDWEVVPVIMQGFVGLCPGGPSDITVEIAVEVGTITVAAMEACK